MINDISQVSRTLRTSASGRGSSLGFSCKTAGHSTDKRKPLRRFKVGKDLGQVVLNIITAELRPAVRELLTSMVKDEVGQQDFTRVFNEHDVLDRDEACLTAFAIRCGVNAARTALTAYSARGQLASWRKALPFLPSSYVDAVDYLDVFADCIADNLRAEIATIAPTIAYLNSDQPSPSCWARPAKKDAERGLWTGRVLWVNHADGYTAPLMCGPGKAISDHNRRALLEAMASFVDQNGHNLTASHATIAQVAIDKYGCTLSEKTAEHRSRKLRSLLLDGKFLIRHEKGGWLKNFERIAAEVHHGRNQAKCASTCDLNLPDHLRPAPSKAPNGPAHLRNLASRLAERDRKNAEKSPYIVGSGFQSPIGNTWVAPPRACAQEHPRNSTLKPQRAKPSLRDWRIVDDLTRRGVRSSAENGPYAHLIGSTRSQMTPAQLAALISTLVPPEIDTKLLLRGLAHTATSRSTGFVALGLRTRPRSARAWLTAVLRSIDWNQSDSFPLWSTTAQAFGVHWFGDRHQWRPTSSQSVARAAPAGPPATATQRAGHLAQIRMALT